MQNLKNHNIYWRSEVGWVVEHVRAQMSINHTSIEVSSAPRSWNEAAHHIAKRALISIQDQIWMEARRRRLCGGPGESVLHALFVCKHASDVWDLSPFSGYVLPSCFAFFRDVWDNRCSVFSSDEFQFFVLLLWGIKGQRNKTLQDRAATNFFLVISCAQWLFDALLRRSSMSADVSFSYCFSLLRSTTV